MSAANSILKVIIIHEDSVTGIQAGEMLRRLSDELGSELGMDINPWLCCDHAWKFEWLQDPQLWAEAVAKAIEADMIIISARCHEELPPAVRSWIESSLPRKQGKSALIALLHGQNVAHSLSPARYLRQLARQYGIDFFCNYNERLAQMEAVIEPKFCQFEDDSAAFEPALTHNSDRQGWGLND